jgi:hypothetical protein
MKGIESRALSGNQLRRANSISALETAIVSLNRIFTIQRRLRLIFTWIKQTVRAVTS